MMRDYSLVASALLQYFTVCNVFAFLILMHFY